MERVLEENPLSQISHLCLGEPLEALGLEAEAGAQWRRSVELDPEFWLGWCYGGMHHAVYGRRTEARRCAEKAFALLPSAPVVIGVLAGTLEASGEASRARELLNGSGADSAGAPVAQACYHLANQRLDEAIQWIGKAAERNFMITLTFLIRPYEKFLAKSSAWTGLLGQLGLDPAVTD